MQFSKFATYAKSLPCFFAESCSALDDITEPGEDQYTPDPVFQKTEQPLNSLERPLCATYCYVLL